jgi:membrane protease YdiL (CAAX protease family)
MRDVLPVLANSFVLLLALVGAVLLWRLVLSPAARARPAASALAAWEAPGIDLFVFLFAVVTGSFLFSLGGGLVTRSFGLVGDLRTVVHGAAAQLGMLAGVAAFWLQLRQGPLPPPPPPADSLRTGVIAFLVALPLLLATAKLWELGLSACGLPVEKQDLVGMFANADSPWVLAGMIVLAVVVAPLTEELVFRAGLFRFLRGRVPRWLALLGPALFFAMLHVNWSTLQGLASLAPLVVLAVVFSLAYERTGHIGTPIVAHACFNLNTILVILSGAAR